MQHQGHRKNLSLLGAITLLCLFLLSAGCSNDSESVDSSVTTSADTPVAGPGKATSAANADADVELFFNAYFDSELAYSPEHQTSLGLKTAESGQWDDRSDAGREREVQRYRDYLSTLQAFDRNALSAANQLSYDLLEFELQAELSDLAWYQHFYVVDQFNGQVTNRLSLLLNDHTVDNAQDANYYIERIRGLGALFNDTVARLRDRAEFGVLTPSFAYPDMLTDIGGLDKGTPIAESGEPHILMLDLAAKLEKTGLSKLEQDELLAEAGSALRVEYKTGLDALLAEIERQSTLSESSNGVWSLPNGDAFYAAQIVAHTTLDLTADEVHQRGLDDIERIHQEMRAIMAQVGFEGSLQDFFVFVRTDPSNFYPNTDAGREEFLAVARLQTEEIFAVADQYFNRLPKAGLEVRRVEPWRENSTSIAFYQSPSEDGARPGYYYANLRDMSTYQKSVATAITYHEGVPGHHFQIALAQELEGLPKFRKYSGYGAYTEGWALYSEQLAREMGFYQDPMSNFGRLHDEIWRSARLVIDTGIHAKRWTREQAIEFFRENTPLSEGDMVTEVERFFVTPGQALGYKVGMMKILELRARAQEKLGDAYDIRNFHDVVIGQGAMPMPVLEAQVDAYITRTLAR
ncbi:MAG: DUF885 domain-containing protein [Halioglobus sp.]